MRIKLLLFKTLKYWEVLVTIYGFEKLYLRKLQITLISYMFAHKNIYLSTIKNI